MDQNILGSWTPHIDATSRTVKRRKNWHQIVRNYDIYVKFDNTDSCKIPVLWVACLLWPQVFPHFPHKHKILKRTKRFMKYGVEFGEVWSLTRRNDLILPENVTNICKHSKVFQLISRLNNIALLWFFLLLIYFAFENWWSGICWLQHIIS